MQVFKFGGACLNDGKGLERLYKIVSSVSGKIVVVVSAMGKTTNEIEKLISGVEKKVIEKGIEEIKASHYKIIDEAFKDPEKTGAIIILGNYIKELTKIVSNNSYSNTDERYDAIVSLGEIISSHIVSLYLTFKGLMHNVVDARKIIVTDSTFKDANVDFLKTKRKVTESIIANGSIVLTQGFIGADERDRTTTLGREGSDYTAAIIANCLNADSVTVWKDVKGMLNADPKWFDNTVKIDHLSYHDAIELAYYGASVIHPKTIKPLQNKGIPLCIKSFLAPLEAGTVIDGN